MNVFLKDPLFVPPQPRLKRLREGPIPPSAKRQKIQKKSNILVYCGPGTYSQSTDAIVSQLQQSLLGFKIKKVDSDYLRFKPWEHKSIALVMGGGMCGEWENSLQIDGMYKIREFVLNGGKYFGICAGAYFGASQSEFNLLGKSPIIKERPLQFFSGRAFGPLLPTENHLAPEAALAISIDLPSKSGLCYYQGGCGFAISENSPTTKILGKYSNPILGAAIISCQVGAGIAVLCGPHPEFIWSEQSSAHPIFYGLMEQLVPQESFRQHIWKVMIKELFN